MARPTLLIFPGILYHEAEKKGKFTFDMEIKQNKNKVVSYPTDIRYKHMQDYILVAFPILSATPTGTITIVVDGEGIVCSELRY